jgi:hypothetical protein
MTYAEAKKRLEDWYEDNSVEISPELLDCCYDALKRVTLEAKKPRLIGGRMMCPNCLRNERALHFYCDCCGQPIDWSDEVKAIFDEAGWDDE